MTATMKIGTTTFAFRYSFLDPAAPPTLAEIIRQCRAAGVERLQVCENVRPLEIPPAEWAEARRVAADLGVDLLLGCKTLRPAVVEAYLRLAQELACDQLRIVMEEPPEHANRDNVRRLLDDIVPKLQTAGLRLAIENHFDIPSAVLLELAAAFPPATVGFCVDTANSLRSFESPAEVLRLLGPRAFLYHLKDYRIVGSLVSFAVVGAPLGEGALALDACLRSIFTRPPVPPLFVETWTPSENDRAGDIARDAEWLRVSVRNLRAHLLNIA
jgi:sugar phosphate isomerase/epimerase